MLQETPPFEITFLAAVPYQFHLQGRTQRLAHYLSVLGHRVRYVAAPTPRAMVRHWLRPWRDRSAGPIELVWPLPMLPLWMWRSTGLTRLMAGCQAGWLSIKSRSSGPHVVCVSSPVWAPMLRGLSADLVVYDCIDDPAVHARPGCRDLFAAWHEDLCRSADLIVAVSASLAKTLPTSHGKPVTVLGNGVDAEAFLSGAGAGDALLRETRVDGTVEGWFQWRRSHPDVPVAGFVGSVDEWVDVELLSRTAIELPEIHFAVIGPVRRPGMLDALDGLANVTRIGWVPYRVVPLMMSTFNASLIPFRPGPVTSAADPIKLYESFVLGQPVVSTYPFREDAVETGLMTVAQGSSFAEAVRVACEEGCGDAAAVARREYARRHDWRVRADCFRDEIVRHLPSTRAEKSASLSKV